MDRRFRRRVSSAPQKRILFGSFFVLVRRPNLANTNSLGRENSHDDVSELIHEAKARARRRCGVTK